MERPLPLTETLHEAVGIFSDPLPVEAAVRDLMLVGFDHADISVLASQQTVRRRLGNDYQDTHLAEDDPCAPRQAWIDPESRVEGRTALTGILAYVGAVTMGGIAFAGGGADAMALTAGALGAGVLGSVGYGLGRLFDGKQAEKIRGHLEHGGIVLWVKVTDDDRAFRASEVLRRHGAADVHIHQLSPSESQAIAWQAMASPDNVMKPSPDSFGIDTGRKHLRRSPS